MIETRRLKNVIFFQTIISFVLSRKTREIFLFKNYAESETRGLVPDLFFFQKINMRWKKVVCSLVSTYFDSAQLAIQ